MIIALYKSTFTIPYHYFFNFISHAMSFFLYFVIVYICISCGAIILRTKSSITIPFDQLQQWPILMFLDIVDM